VPATVRLTLAQADLQRQLTGDQGMVTRYVLRRTQAIRNRAVLYCPVDTGNLRSSIVSAVRSDGMVVVGTVGTPVDYAVAVHEGTRPHVIRPRRARVLAWGPPGARVFATFARHPGTRGRPFLRRALEEVMAGG
jgi:hypothetical protein